MSPNNENQPALSDHEPSVYAALSGPLSPWQTRLVKLLPAAGLDADLRCEMFVANVTYNEGVGIPSMQPYQKYEALSYSWGYPELTGAVECSGIWVGIPPAMETALRYLRFENNPRWLWCDALCI